MSKFDKLLAELNSKGIVLNNLYQLTDGSFKINLRRWDSFGFDYAYGSTPLEALERAAAHTNKHVNVNCLEALKGSVFKKKKRTRLKQRSRL